MEAKRQKGIAGLGTQVRCGSYAIWAFVLLGSLLLYAVSLWWGELNQDEGWYLYAGRMVQEGYVPYRDFAFTQGPLMAYVYGLAYPLVRWQGVFGGRIFTAVLSWAGLCLAIYLVRLVAKRKGQHPFWPMLFVSVFWGLNLYQVYYTTIVKTYALAAVCMLGGMILLEHGLASTDRKSEKTFHAGIFLSAFLGGGLLAMAAGVRLSAAFLLPACWIPLVYHWIRREKPHALGLWLTGMLVGGTLGICLLFVPFGLLDADALRFGLFDYHTGRSVESGFGVLAYKVGFLLRLMQAYWPLLAVTLLLPWGHRSIKAARSSDSRKERGRLLHVPFLIGFVVVSCIHLLSVFPYDDYQVFIMPLAMVVVALSVGRFVECWQIEQGVKLRWVGCLVFVMFAFALSGERLQGWFVGSRDLIWWPLREQSSLGQLRDVGWEMRAGKTRAAVDGTVITQDLYLAVESGYRVPRGMELGPFANFWSLSDSEAARYGVLNYNRAKHIIQETDAAWAAYSGYGFAIAAPQIIPIADVERNDLLASIDDHFVFVDVFVDFGQAMTDLRLYRKQQP